MKCINFTNLKDYIEEHEYHFQKFCTTRDFKHFEAAKAIAAAIMKYEKNNSSYGYYFDFKKMYFDGSDDV